MSQLYVFRYLTEEIKNKLLILLLGFGTKTANMIRIRRRILFNSGIIPNITDLTTLWNASTHIHIGIKHHFGDAIIRNTVVYGHGLFCSRDIGVFELETIYHRSPQCSKPRILDTINKNTARISRAFKNKVVQMASMGAYKFKYGGFGTPTAMIMRKEQSMYRRIYYDDYTNDGFETLWRARLHKTGRKSILRFPAACCSSILYEFLIFVKQGEKMRIEEKTYFEERDDSYAIYDSHCKPRYISEGTIKLGEDIAYYSSLVNDISRQRLSALFRESVPPRETEYSTLSGDAYIL